MLQVETSQLTAQSNPNVATGADAQILEANSERNGLEIQAAGANTGTVFLTLVTPGQSTPAASATSAHIELNAGQTWPGTIGGVLWTGRVRAFSAAAQVVRIAET